MIRYDMIWYDTKRSDPLYDTISSDVIWYDTIRYYPTYYDMFMRSIVLISFPHLSHWSPRAPSHRQPGCGYVPSTRPGRVGVTIFETELLCWGVIETATLVRYRNGFSRSLRRNNIESLSICKYDIPYDQTWYNTIRYDPIWYVKTQFDIIWYNQVKTRQARWTILVCSFVSIISQNNTYLSARNRSQFSQNSWSTVCFDTKPLSINLRNIFCAILWTNEWTKFSVRVSSVCLLVCQCQCQ